MNEWERKDKEYIWHPFTQMLDWVDEPQLVIAEAEGIKLIDTEGKAYYDGVSSLWVNIHGHRKAEIDQAIIAQLGKVAHTTMLGLTNIPASELAEQLIHIAPKGLDKLFYSDDGSTAVEVALKLAYQYWQLKGKKSKQLFVTLDQAYHGDTVGTVSVGGIDTFHRIFKPLLFETLRVPSPSCYHCQLSQTTVDCKMVCIEAVETVLKERHNEIAAMVIEPLIQAAAGMLTQPQGYLAKVRELTQKYDVLLIVDEVATGFGRTGKMFACDVEGISPDLMTVSKGITAGYMPLAVTYVTQKIYDAFLGSSTSGKTFYHGHSYTGNPLACAAALANLKVFRDEKVLEGLSVKIDSTRSLLEPIKDLPHVGNVRQCGLMVGIELVQTKEAKKPYPAAELIGRKVCLKARDYGLIIRNIGDVVVFMPPLVSKAEEITEMVTAIRQAIVDITE